LQHLSRLHQKRRRLHRPKKLHRHPLHRQSLLLHYLHRSLEREQAVKSKPTIER
jgi:hypothetical protein